MLGKKPEGPGRSQPCMAGNGPLGDGLEGWCFVGEWVGFLLKCMNSGNFGLLGYHCLVVKDGSS